MPAASDPRAVTAPDLPHTWRPTGPRIAGVVFSVVLIGGFAWLWVNFDDGTRAAVSGLQRATVIFFVGLGVSFMLALARCRVTATETGLTVVNGFRTHRYEWAEVVAVRMPMGAPWPQLDLSDATTRPMLGIQGSDGASARRAVRELKAVVAAQSA